MLHALLAALYQIILFIFYFFYFLFKGKPEWQKTDDCLCARNSPVCCLHNSTKEYCSQDKDARESGINEDFVAEKGRCIFQRRTSLFMFSDSSSRICGLNQQHVNKAIESMHKFAALILRFFTAICTFLKDGIYWLMALIGNDMQRSVNQTDDKNLDDFVQKYFDNEWTMKDEAVKQNQEEQEKIDIIQFSTTGAPLSKSNESEMHERKEKFLKQNEERGAQFYTTKRRISENCKRDEDPTASLYPIPLSPPPPPLAPIWITSPQVGTMQKVPKGAVPLFPPDVLAGTHAYLKQKKEKSREKVKSPNSEIVDGDWTVSNARMIFQDLVRPHSSFLKEYDDRDNVFGEEEDVHWIPPKKSVVSKISKPNDPNAQFIFRASKPQMAEIHSRLSENNFIMGQSVFSPIKEAEELRTSINRKATATPESHLGSRIATPCDDYTYNRQTPIERYHYDYYTPIGTEQYLAPRSHSHSRLASLISRFDNSQHISRTNGDRINVLKQRSRTVEPRSNLVMEMTRHWPPKNNTAGVEIVKNNWNSIPTEIISCRRTAERSVTNKWTTKDDKGRVLNEYSTRQWIGENDGLRRRGDGTGESWRNVVEVKPDGKTNFFENRKYYTKNYLIESESHNIK